MYVYVCLCVHVCEFVFMFVCVFISIMTPRGSKSRQKCICQIGKGGHLNTLSFSSCKTISSNSVNT